MKWKNHDAHDADVKKKKHAFQKDDVWELHERESNSGCMNSDHADSDVHDGHAWKINSQKKRERETKLNWIRLWWAASSYSFLPFFVTECLTVGSNIKRVKEYKKE